MIEIKPENNRPPGSRAAVSSWTVAAFALLAAGIATGCSGPSSAADAGSGAVPDAGLHRLLNPELGSLDVDGDGALTASDLEPGQAALLWVHFPPEGEPAIHREVTSDASFRFENGRWGMQIAITRPGAEGTGVNFSFPHTNPDAVRLVVGPTDVHSVNLDIASLERGGHLDDDLGDVGVVTVVDSTDETGTGRWEGDVEVAVVDYETHEKTHERFLFRGAAFNAIPSHAHLGGAE